MEERERRGEEEQDDYGQDQEEEEQVKLPHESLLHFWTSFHPSSDSITYNIFFLSSSLNVMESHDSVIQSKPWTRHDFKFLSRWTDQGEKKRERERSDHRNEEMKRVKSTRNNKRNKNINCFSTG